MFFIAGFLSGAEGRTRTDTEVAPQQFLRLPRLPFRHFGGAEERNRTADTLIFSQVLYRLSYLGTSERKTSALLLHFDRVKRSTDTPF